MKIGLIDVDGHNFVNLPLMKISAYHKSVGHSVEWWWGLEPKYDIVYMAKVFTETYSHDSPEPHNAQRIIKGGTGYMQRNKDNLLKIYHDSAWITIPEEICKVDTVVKNGIYYTQKLPSEIENQYPDYSLYPDLTKNTAYGYLTRGCPKNCGYCCVSQKEGLRSVKVADLNNFWRGQKEIKLLDPNILACSEHIDLLGQIIDSKAWIDFTQGLDIKLVNDKNIELINKLKVKMLHFAWDNPDENLAPLFENFAAKSAVKDFRKLRVYVLTNYNSTHEEDLYRIYTLSSLGFDPYVMVYDKPDAPQITRHLQRWCNNKRIFRVAPNFDSYIDK